MEETKTIEVDLNDKLLTCDITMSFREVPYGHNIDGNLGTIAMELVEKKIDLITDEEDTCYTMDDFSIDEQREIMCQIEREIYS